jgi:glycosyltransferase involved in cell wall biosynthesis
LSVFQSLGVVNFAFLNYREYLMTKQKVSVVVCTKNEESRIEDCLKSISLNQPDEIILVDGGSTDKTVEIARKYTDKIFQSAQSNLTRDRQIGINASKSDLIAMIDADHRLKPGDLESLLADLAKYDLDIVQSQLVSYKNMGFWDAAEEETWSLTHNIPGRKAMIGTAPNIYKKKIFELEKFDDQITKTIDDTDFIYRLSKHPEIKFGIGETQISQLHFATLSTYVKKFKWYGKGDGEFCKKNPNRAPSMFFHLLIRYPFIYSLKGLLKGKFRTIPFFMLQGWLRFYGLAKYLLLN